MHFWFIHKKLYKREWQNLDYRVRREILADLEGETAIGFFKYLHAATVKVFEDPEHSYNSRYRFQYNP